MNTLPDEQYMSFFDSDASNNNCRTFYHSRDRELGAYEELWLHDKVSYKTIAEKFAERKVTESTDSLPSDFVSPDEADKVAEEVKQKLQAVKGEAIDFRVRGAGELPDRLGDAQYPVEFLYYQGRWELIDDLRSVAVIGTRNPTPEGQKLARGIVKSLVEDGFTIVSGLASGIDTVAHTSALEHDGKTIAVIGTPLCHVYPKDNRQLQEKIGQEFLLISQVPVLRYESRDYRYNRQFFPERNKTMSALTKATIIVEAGEISGTLIQARAALKQQRKLIILNSCFRDQNLTWPEKFEREGAVRAMDYRDIRNALSD